MHGELYIIQKPALNVKKDSRRSRAFHHRIATENVAKTTHPWAGFDQTHTIIEVSMSRNSCLYVILPNLGYVGAVILLYLG